MQSGLVTAFLERTLEEVDDLVVVRERPLRESEPATGAQRAGRERIDHGCEELRRAVALTGLQEILRQR